MSITLTIDGNEVTVPEGTLLVDAAKRQGTDVPVFCYHPKMEPVGMCRVCLVEIGRPGRDRATGKPLFDEAGNPMIQLGPNLETACTVPVGQGWQVRVASEKAIQGAQRNCRIPSHLPSSSIAQFATRAASARCRISPWSHGPGKSRFLFDDKDPSRQAPPSRGADLPFLIASDVSNALGMHPFPGRDC